MLYSADPQFDTPYAAAFQGALGSFSEIAAGALLGEHAQFLPCRRLEEVFDAVRGGRARLGVVPIENTFVGSIHVCYDLLLDRELSIVGEYCMHVDVALVVRPGTLFESVRQVLSHPSLLALCDGFFRRNPFVEAVPAFDSAVAVERVVESDRRDLAAIASRRAAEVHGGEIVEHALDTASSGNARFLLIGRPTEARLSFDGESDQYKTSIAFAAENRSGALHSCLRPFAERGITLTKIESRPLGHVGDAYHFYVDVVGRIDDERMVGALDELELMASRVRVLGCYLRHELGGDAGTLSE